MPRDRPRGGRWQVGIAALSGREPAGRGGVQRGMAAAFLLGVLLAGCSSPPAQATEAPVPAAEAGADAFAAFLGGSGPVADGFSAPLPGWTPCGEGCGEAQSARAVRSWAAGVVERTGPEGVVVHHRWYENHEPRELRVVWSGFEPAVAAGASVERGGVLGRGRTVHVTAEGLDEALTAFAAARPTLPVPQAEPVLALVSHDLAQMRIYRQGAEVGRYEVGFGQATGAKVRRGDNRSPKGVYYVVQHATGPFSGASAAYFGGYWMRLNYPNAWDAARGARAGLIDAPTQARITRAWAARRETSKATALGGGIGFHGWAYEWEDAGSRRLSWGCVVLHLRDVAEIYAALPDGAMVVLF